MTTVASNFVAAANRNDSPPWKLGFRSLETEIAQARALEVRGTMPKELSGVLYRMGPARHDVYGDRLRSWFDGDGMVHAVAIEGGRVTYRNRFVATLGKLAEDRVSKRLYAAFDTSAPGGPVARFLHRNRRKNPANTNVVFHSGKLLALCESGRPYRLDPETLDTIGEDDMSGTLAPDATYSAHAKLDPETDEMWNFGASYGREARLHVYCTTKEGETRLAAELTMPVPVMVHDFAISRTKVVFVLAPIVLPRVPLGLLLGQTSFGESLRYRPELGVSVAVVDRATGETRWSRTDPFMLFHTVNAWDEGNDVALDVCAYPDAVIMRTIEDVMAGDTPHRAPSYVERLRVESSGRVTRTRLSETPLEFPRVAGRAFGKEHHKVYGVAWPEGRPFFAQPVVIDTVTGEARLATLGPGEFAGECVPVSKANAASESDVWLLTLVLDGASRATELRVLDGSDVTAPAVASVRLPQVVPFGFHGNWVRRPASAIRSPATYTPTSTPS
jgi:all-trans-8'-apo-beta-carotenal 15,15'-oxygenase